MSVYLYRWEEADIGLSDPFTATVTLRVTYRYIEGEAASHDTPATPSRCDVRSVEVERIDIFDDAGNTLDGLAMGLDPEKVLECFYAEHDDEELADECLVDWSLYVILAREASAEERLAFFADCWRDCP